MRFTAEKLLALVDSLPDPVFILTESGIYADIVGRPEAIDDSDRSFLIDKKLADVLPEALALSFLDEIKKTLDQNSLRVIEYDLAGTSLDKLNVNSGSQGTLRFEGRIVPLKERYYGERTVLWTAINITEQYQLRKQIEQLSMTDELTGAPNRRAFNERLEREFSEFQRYRVSTSIAVVDIDEFKCINDSHGHSVGDQILKLFVECRQAGLRASDFLARFGGDEFVVIFPHTRSDHAKEILTRFSAIFTDTSRAAAGIPATLSVGISEFKPSDESPQQAMKRADIALYNVKLNGRAGVQADTDMEITL